MRSAPHVLALAFVLAASTLVALPASAQIGSDGTLSGYVCTVSYGGYPRPLYAEEGGSSSDAPCYRGIPGASVRIQSDGALPPVDSVDRTATTDESGYFTADGLDDGTYTVTVTRDGFATASSDAAVEDGRGDIQLALEANEVTLRGLVTDKAGAPVQDAEVTIYGEPWMSYADGPIRAGDDGRFEATVRAGFHSVNIQAPGFQSFYEERFVDGGEEPAFRMVPVPPTNAVLYGIVQDQDGNPVPDVRVSAYSYQPCCYAYEGDGVSADPASSEPAYYGGETFAYSDSAGQYRLGVYAGEVSVNLQKEGHAGAYFTQTVAKGEEAQHDVELLRYPEKTARIVGRVTDGDGNGVEFVSISLRSPEYGIYECSVLDADNVPPPADAPATDAKMSIAPEPYPGYSGCAIQVHSDGSFEGFVTPGYTILSIWHDHWRGCNTTTDADGSSKTDCGPEFYGFAQTLTLPADAETRVDVQLRERPAPNAVVSGYLVDGSKSAGIPHAMVSFSNQDGYGWGQAESDGDGSYSLRLREGYHSVSVWAEGFLPWEGVVNVEAGEQPFDIVLTPGQESYGGCYGCHYARGYDDVAVAAAEPAMAPMPGAASTDAKTGMSAEDLDESAAAGFAQDGEQNSQFTDLGGGLGPYDAAKRQEALADEAGNDSPGPGLALLAVGLVAAVALLRRRS